MFCLIRGCEKYSALHSYNLELGNSTFSSLSVSTGDLLSCSLFLENRPLLVGVNLCSLTGCVLKNVCNIYLKTSMATSETSFIGSVHISNITLHISNAK